MDNGLIYCCLNLWFFLCCFFEEGGKCPRCHPNRSRVDGNFPREFDCAYEPELKQAEQPIFSCGFCPS
jgi:hypothetical protein